MAASVVVVPQHFDDDSFPFDRDVAFAEIVGPGEGFVADAQGRRLPARLDGRRHLCRVSPIAVVQVAATREREDGRKEDDWADRVHGRESTASARPYGAVAEMF